MASFLNTLRINFLYVDQYTFGSTWIYPESTIPYGMVRYILHGSAVFYIDGEELTVYQDEVIYIPEGCRLSCYALEDEFSFISIRFNLSVQAEQEDILTHYFGISRVTNCRQQSDCILGYFKEVLCNALTSSRAKSFRIHGNLELILAYLAEQSGETIASHEEPDAVSAARTLQKRAGKNNIKMDPRIQSVIDFLVLNPTMNLDSDHLCKIADMSVTSLRRSFKKHTGKTLGDFLKELRIMTAARKMLTTNDRISAIAYELGFHDANYFSRSFKSVFGVSPQHYRKIARE